MTAHRTLVVVAHPDLAASRITAQLAAAIRDLDGVTVRELASAYPDRRVDAGYTGWWSCLIPAEVTRAMGYPLPLFFQWDDVEYSYRGRAHGFATVTLPGAGLWHVWRISPDEGLWQLRDGSGVPLLQQVCKRLSVPGFATVMDVHLDPDRVRGRSPLRDRTYVTSVALNSVIAMQFSMTSVGVPLWIVTRTEAPTVVISVLLVLNTVVVALFQVRAARGTHDIAVAGRTVRRGSLLLAAGCLLYAAAGSVGAVAAVALLVARKAVDEASR